MEEEEEATAAVSRIVIGSCNSQHFRHQPFWPVILSRDPTAFVWAGDAVYADDRTEGKFPHRKVLDATPEYLGELLRKQRKEPGYEALLNSGIGIFGAVDDHDYGRNNGDRTFPFRRENAVVYADFLGLPDGSPVVKRAEMGLGLYGVQVYDFDEPDPTKRLLSDEEAALDPDAVADADFSERRDPPPGDNRKVAGFALDVRSNRTPWPEQANGGDGCILGEEQFRWFETAIGRSDAAVNIVVTGLQVHAERYYDSSKVESWSGFPGSQHRLYQALLRPNVRAPIVVSGDVHLAQLLRKDCRRMGPREEPEHTDDDEGAKAAAAPNLLLRPLHEVTTSGMTHSWGSVETSTCGRVRMSPVLCTSGYANRAKRFVVQFAHLVFPWKDLVVDDGTNELQYALDLNVAELEFDWEGRQVVTSILGHRGQMLLQQRWSFGQLTGIRDTMVPGDEFRSMAHRLQSRAVPVGETDWVCVHYRGTPNPLAFAAATFATGLLVFVLLAWPILVPLLMLCRFNPRRR